MKLVHISDLHIGKRVAGYSMIDDQIYILEQIAAIIDEISPRAVLISGDVYDKSAPSDEAVRVLNSFLTGLIMSGHDIYMISGNHDSAAKLSFASKILNNVSLHISPEYDGTTPKYTLSDGDIAINLYLLPFIKPAIVRASIGDEEIKTYSDAVRAAIERMDVDKDEINVIMAHQFVLGAQRSESEDISVGGTDGMDADAFDEFDYVALGHLHRPQYVKRETIRYCGTPLKYSLSEVVGEKSVSIVDIRDKNNITIETIPLKPLHDMRKITGKYSELMDKGFYEGTATDDYIHVVLTDEDEVSDAMARLRTVYPNIMSLSYSNMRTSVNNEVAADNKIDKKTPLEIWESFYETQNNQPMNKDQKNLMEKLIEQIWQ